MKKRIGVVGLLAAMLMISACSGEKAHAGPVTGDGIPVDVITDNAADNTADLAPGNAS